MKGRYVRSVKGIKFCKHRMQEPYCDMCFPFSCSWCDTKEKCMCKDGKHQHMREGVPMFKVVHHH